MTSTQTTQLLIEVPEQINSPWLGEVLGIDDLAVESVERIGTGQMSQSHRVQFGSPTGGGGSVVVKLASDDPGSRATGVGMGAYRREVDFYDKLAERIGGTLPQCHLAVYDEKDGWFTLVLQDIVGATQGDQIAGCSVAEARLAMRELARVHAPVFNDAAVGTSEYLNLPNPLNQALLSALLPGFLERYADRIAPEHADVCRTFVSVADAWDADVRAPLGLIHGDFRLDNLLFTPEECTVVDWQTVAWGPAMRDAAYFLGSGPTVADRRLHELDFLRIYYDELVARGISNFSWEQCWEEYRRQTFAVLVINIVAAMVVVRTDRGDDMFITVLARACQQILDLDALELLPQVGEAMVALRPEPADEGRHTPGAEPLWNESWYFDAVDDSETLGLYVRLGRVPNRDHYMYTVSIVRPGQPALLVSDNAVPLAAGSGSGDGTESIAAQSLRATQECIEPLTRFRVTFDATAESHVDHSAPLRLEPGEPVEVSADLIWETDGIPYQWRVATRYEIPCRVTGVVRIGDQEFTLAGPGQRDHSWGSRDWWAADWMWSAFHLEDGTRTHAVTVPSMPGGLAVGYVQRGAAISEVQTGRCTESVADDGLISAATISTGPEELSLEVEPLAFGALRLDSTDGRVSHFPRALARVRAADGRRGVGWIEWNRNQPLE